MPTIEHNKRFYQVDEDGFLVGSGNWDENWADYVREIEGICELSEEHRKVIGILRDYYQEKGAVLPVGSFSRFTGLTLNKIYDLFPSGPIKGACKMAGLKRPPVS
ncbi:MAG: hypothetical protein ACD_15C00151G0004 [uncultured bacterium]|nr:MAG: hypothetical protein ACD_15C00151G0004 [uncultured bacterium]